MGSLDGDFAADEAVALLLICQGLEQVFCETVPDIRTQILPSGGVDGEASVGKVLASASKAELLRLSVHPGVQSSFALLLARRLDPDLSELAKALEASPRWPAALSLWRASAPLRWPTVQEEFAPEIRARMMRARSARGVRFRGSAVRDGRHDFEAGEVMGKLGGAAKRRTGWEVSLTKYDTEVFAVVCGQVVVVGLPLFPEWRGAASGLAERPERFFVLPREVRPYLRPDVHINYGRMRLRPSTCFLLLQLAKVKAGDVLLDPMGGVGTIAIEAAVRFERLAAISSDLSADATTAAAKNAAAAERFLASGASVRVAQEDVRRLSLADASVDAVVSDVPFGNRNRLVWVNGLLPAMLSSVARVLRPFGRLVLLLTRAHARQLLQLLEGEAVFQLLESHKVAVGGWPAAVLVLQRLAGDVSTKSDRQNSARAAETEPTECVLMACPLQDQQLSDCLLQRWPSHFPTESVARRVTGRGRVWVKDASVWRKGWWSEPVCQKTILFVPDYPRRSPHKGDLTVLCDTSQLCVVVKEPGLRLFGGVRTLQSLLQASCLSSDLKDAFPYPQPVHFVEADVGGCVLCAKTASAAFALAGSSLNRTWRGLFVEKPPEGWQEVRQAPSVRFGRLVEAEICYDGAGAALRQRCGVLKAPLLGDTAAGFTQATLRRRQVFLVVSGVTFDFEGEHTVSLPEGSVRRFEHLFAREAHVYQLESNRLAEEKQHMPLAALLRDDFAGNFARRLVGTLFRSLAIQEAG